MHKRALLWMLILALFLPSAALAEAEAQKRVYRVDEEDAVPFAEDAQTLELYVCSLLGADSMILTVQGRTVLVDMGAVTSFETIDGLLQELGVERIDIAFNSHPHNDHLGAMEQLAGKYPVGVFMTAFPENYTGSAVIQKPAIKALRAAGIPVVTVSDGDTLVLGDARMTVIRQGKYESPNRLSAMLRIEYGDCTLLLTGDVEDAAQPYLAELYTLSADIFKYPHHGLSKLDKAFLEAIGAEYTFFTHGSGDTKEAQKQMDKAGIPYDFATWGTIHISTNGEYWLVEQWLNEKGLRYSGK